MTKLIRDELKNTFSSHPPQTAHAGLLLQRRLAMYEGSGEKPVKSALINTIAAVEASPLYKLAFERWLAFTGTRPQQFSSLIASIDGRLFSGLSTGGSLETGVITQHTYGMPMIAGSSIKGAVRQYAEAIRLDPKYRSILFGHAEDDEAQDDAGNELSDTAGYLVWHDAWWIPDTGEKKPFVKEVVTVHHQDYYTGSQLEATDFDSPVPNQQVGVQGSFYFAIEGEKRWVDFAIDLLRHALLQNGLGAKAASGYGYFKLNTDLSAKLLKQVKSLNDAAEEAQRQKKAEEELEGLSENQQFIRKCEMGLPDKKLWENKPNQVFTVQVEGKKYSFIEVFNIVDTWESVDDLKYAIAFFETHLKVWTGKPLGQNKTWKDRINPLKRRAGLIA